MEDTMSNLLEHAKTELKLAGYDISEKGCNQEDPMGGYANACAKSAYELVETLSKQGHSGMSVGITLGLFNKLAKWQTLTPITNNPDEWIKLQGCEDGPWQNKRNPSCFSEDLKTYHDVEADENYIVTIEDGWKSRTRKEGPWIEHPLKDYKEGK